MRIRKGKPVHFWAKWITGPHPVDGFEVTCLPKWARFVAYQERSKLWHVCELTTGQRVRGGKNFVEAVLESMAVLHRAGKDTFLKIISEQPKINP